MDENDPLASLIVDAVELDRQRIADALSGIVYIDRSGRVVPGDGFAGLNQTEKILAVLLGRKVAVMLQLADAEAAGPTELAAETGISPGSIRPALRRLYSDRLVSQDGDSGYYLSPHQVGTAIDRLSESSPEVAGGEDGSQAPKRSGRARAKPKSKRRVVKPKGTSATSDGNGEKMSRRAKSGFSWTAAVRDLIDQGFFETPKTLSDVQRHMKDKQGREVPTTSLSPIFTRLLRSGDLDRARNAEGAYEYTATP